MHNGSHRIREVYFAMCKQAGTPTALACWLAFRDDQKSLLELDFKPERYVDVDAFRKDYQCVNYLSKYKGLHAGADPDAEARKRFVAAEEQCSDTNKRLRNCRSSVTNTEMDAVLHAAARKIAMVLGPLDRADLHSTYGWGPGATADIPRRKAQVDYKLSKLPLSVTPHALPLARQVIGDDLHWSSVVLGVTVESIQGPFCFLPTVFAVTPDSVIDMVPKNAKTHRTIAKEPTLNAFLQKGVGGWIRRRLKRVGVNLDDQGPNQRAARAAYLDGLSTLDLKSASDTVSTELVYELLPVDWALHLDAIRSKSYRGVMAGTFNKFSSMGNGFTFELESLIFYGLTKAVCERYGAYHEQESVWIYGDDIVCPRSVATKLIEVLDHCGFTVNSEKSYIDGYFFESCGKHYFKGVDVTPAYQKEVPESLPELVRASNRLMRKAVGHGWLNRDYRAPWLAMTRGLDLSTCALPLGTDGDEGLLLPRCLFPSYRFNPNYGFRCRVVRNSVRRFPAHEAALLAWSLRRGVETEQPFMGDVSVPVDDKPAFGWRWVVPNGEFGLSW